MSRSAVLAVVLVCVSLCNAFGQKALPDWHMVYTPSHRATYVKEWRYSFPKHEAARWVIALRYPPMLPWSRNVVGKAELLTSAGWKPFQEVTEGSGEKRRMLFIDYAHNDPKLRTGFTIRTTLTATICDQQLARGKPASAHAPLAAVQRAAFLKETETFDFSKPSVKGWMDQHRMWLNKGEKTLDFVHRVYKELRNPQVLPYETKDGGQWICSQILRVGYGECCRHAIVGTSILRANKIPARTVCGLWAIDNVSTGGHCWGEFFLDGVGWVPYDTTIDSEHPRSEAYFGVKKDEVLAGMVDFDWVINAGPFGRQTVFAIDAFPAYWSQGKGAMDEPKVEMKEHVQIVKRSR